MWLAMKLAAAAGQVEVLGLAPDDAMPFGVQIIVHAAAAAAALAPRLPGIKGSQRINP